MSSPARKLFVTTALPYANGNFHIGHIMEYIQADIWVRFQRMQGNAVNFVGADDTHGAPIMIAAEKAGNTPQQFVANIAAGRKQYLDGFHISFDNWHSTDAPENHELARQIYRDLRDRADGSLIEVRTIEQFFDPEKNMFLPDRYIKGECPKCHAKDQYGDNCEVLQHGATPHRPDQPLLGPLGRQARAETLRALLLQAVQTPAAWSFCRTGRKTASCSPRWPTRSRNGSASAPTPTAPPAKAWATGTSAATRPTSASRFRTRPASTSTCGSMRPWATSPSLKNLLEKRGESYDAYMADPLLEQYHFIGKDIITFHTLFWPAMLHFSGRKTPTACSCTAS